MRLLHALKLKPRLSWSITAALSAASIIYFLVAGIILQSDNANIVFIEKERLPGFPIINQPFPPISSCTRPARLIRFVVRLWRWVI